MSQPCIMANFAEESITSFLLLRPLLLVFNTRHRTVGCIYIRSYMLHGSSRSLHWSMLDSLFRRTVFTWRRWLCCVSPYVNGFYQQKTVVNVNESQFCSGPLTVPSQAMATLHDAIFLSPVAFVDSIIYGILVRELNSWNFSWIVLDALLGNGSVSVMDALDPRLEELIKCNARVWVRVRKH